MEKKGCRHLTILKHRHKLRRQRQTERRGRRRGRGREKEREGEANGPFMLFQKDFPQEKHPA